MNPKEKVQLMEQYMPPRDYEKLMGLLNEVNKLFTLSVTISLTCSSALGSYLCCMCSRLLKPVHMKGSFRTYIFPLLSCHVLK